ncbi:uncharacterized protein C8Q71DRAFT_762697 [Rhodofomes roseus]|uniref:Hyaluronan/mRNA-binding protein domain-containing protein n=1 Tax=Rhodofomes roseus TaxID=34475 RepID=A0ABQ8KDG9_9APHY|nr:uncharacterized protein C8Q71DRAFT_762697 [Rhodofomes roseus]KAH9835592.1 hypothetical protein C8Q71DRAFT_762697 [Rhodofomes roseus]
MSVASKNAFALLEDEDSSRPSTPASKPAPTKESAPTPAASTRGTQKSRGGPASRGGRYYQRGGKPTAQGTPDAAEDAAAGEGEAPRKKFERGRGRGRGERGRGGRGGRPFDKHSQTGKVDSEKKVNQGWGADEGDAEFKAETAAEGDAAADATSPTADASGWGAAETGADDWGVPAATEGTPAPEGEKAPEVRRGRDRDIREPEEEDNTLTLEEYLKQQTEKDLAAVPKLEPRKANEGDDSIWKDAVVVSKKDEEESAYFVGKSKSSVPKNRSKKEEKVYIEIDARFERPARGGGRGRGGDRAERGDRGGRGRGRGGGRGRTNGTSATPAVDVDDQSAFPSLS